MEIIFNTLSWGAIIVGSVFCVIGAIGVIRLPDVYCRMHAAGIIDTVGIGLIFLGLAFQAGWTLALAKLAMMDLKMMEQHLLPVQLRQHHLPNRRTRH